VDVVVLSPTLPLSFTGTACLFLLSSGGGAVIQASFFGNLQIVNGVFFSHSSASPSFALSSSSVNGVTNGGGKAAVLPTTALSTGTKEGGKRECGRRRDEGDLDVVVVLDDVDVSGCKALMSESGGVVFVEATEERGVTL
jgi:hypothetical protein